MISLLCINDLEEGTSKGLEIGNRYFFAVKKNDQVFLYRNSCPHLGTPLEWEEDRFLDNDGALIQCSSHGALFLIEDGRCIAGPCKGKSLQPEPFVIEQDMIMVSEE